MKIVKVEAGLGNQMFQYALYRKLSTIYKDVKIDISEYMIHNDHNGYELERVFGVKAKIATKEEVKKLTSKKNNYYKEKKFSYDEEVLNIDGDVYYEGLWQTEKYFKNIEGIIRNDFKFSSPLTGKNLEIANMIKERQAVSIHVRRGDYLNSEVHRNVCSLKYYIKAVNYFKNKLNNPVFFIFSDDIKWSKNNIIIDKNTIYVDWNKGEYSYKDMQLMSLCKHNIIANSTFSWWGAWLNNNPGKIVIAPSKWFNYTWIDTRDIIPEKWIKVFI